MVSEHQQQRDYPDIAKYGIRYTCAKAYLDLREKINSSSFGHILAGLRRRVEYDTLDHSEEMAKRLMTEKEFKYYKSIFL